MLHQVAAEDEIDGRIREHGQIASVSRVELDALREVPGGFGVEVDADPTGTPDMVKEFAEAAAQIEDGSFRLHVFLEKGLDEDFPEPMFRFPTGFIEAVAVEGLQSVATGVHARGGSSYFSND
jgi:hypothetical protein